MSAVVNPWRGWRKPTLLCSVKDDFGRKSKKTISAGSAVPSATRLFAFLVLALLAESLISLWPAACHRWDIRLRFFFASAEQSRHRAVRSVVPIVGTLTTSAIGALHRHPGQLRHCAFPDGAVPKMAAPPLGTAIEPARRYPQHHLRDVGIVVFAPVFGSYVQPFLKSTLGSVPIIGILFQGHRWNRRPDCRHYSRHHGHSVHRLGDARRIPRWVPAVLRNPHTRLGRRPGNGLARVLPYTKVGVVGGIMLGLGRALGETMAVTFVIGNAHRLSASLMEPGKQHSHRPSPMNLPRRSATSIFALSSSPPSCFS